MKKTKITNIFKKTTMAKYLVTWMIDIEDVKTPQSAAKRAWSLRNNPDSIANVFDVKNQETGKTVRVDLWEKTTKILK